MHREKMIVHIVNEDKFTEGYIKFMLLCMNQWKHKFFILNDKKEIGLTENNNVIQLSDWYKLKKRANRNILEVADKVIITGAFFLHIFNFVLTSKIWNKTYIQFWGGDFYDFGQSKKVSSRIRDHIKKRAVSRAKGFIFLIEGEEKQFEKIIGIRKKNYIAPMPNNPEENISYQQIWENNSDRGHQTVLIGNSATRSNGHFEIIDLLKKYERKIIVYCPLSYGDELYRKEVIEYGKNVLGEHFIPLVDFMNKEEYVKFLAKCDVGIFNNNRQQAMGNINLLLYLGKKVYMRKETSMWQAYVDQGYYVYPIDEITNMEIDSFFELEDNAKNNNHRLKEEDMKQIEGIQQWKEIFEL